MRKPSQSKIFALDRLKEEEFWELFSKKPTLEAFCTAQHKILRAHAARDPMFIQHCARSVFSLKREELHEDLQNVYDMLLLLVQGLKSQALRISEVKRKHEAHTTARISLRKHFITYIAQRTRFVMDEIKRHPEFCTHALDLIKWASDEDYIASYHDEDTQERIFYPQYKARALLADWNRYDLD